MMEINVKLMTEEAYRTLQKDLNGLLKMIKDHPSDSSWLKDYLGFEPYETKKYVIEDFTLKCADNYDLVVFDNAVILYEALYRLPKYILCNNRFWAWINMEKAYKQAQMATKDFSIQTLQNLWFMASSRRNIMLGVMSRYFYMINVSIDESRKDKYELSRTIFNNPETYRGFCYRSLGMIKSVTLGVLHAENDFECLTRIPINKKAGAQIVKKASRAGSVMLLDMVNEQEISNYIFPYILEIYGNLLN